MRSYWGLVRYRVVLAAGGIVALLYQIKLLTDPVVGNELLGESALNYLLIAAFGFFAYRLEVAAHAHHKAYTLAEAWEGRDPFAADGVLGEHLKALCREPLPIDLDQQASLERLTEKQKRLEQLPALGAVLLPVGGVSITFYGVIGAMAKMAGAIQTIDFGGEGPADLADMLALLSGAIRDLGVGFYSTLIASVLGALMLRAGVSLVASMREETFCFIEQLVDRQVLPVLREKARRRDEKERKKRVVEQAIENATALLTLFEQRDYKFPAPIVSVPPPKVTWPESLPISLDDDLRQKLVIIGSAAQTTAKIVGPIAPALIEVNKTQKCLLAVLSELLKHFESDDHD